MARVLLFVLVFSALGRADENLKVDSEQRGARLTAALDAFRRTDADVLSNTLEYVQLMNRTRCRGSNKQLKVLCFEEAMLPYCKSRKGKFSAEDCLLYSDVIITNRLAESQFISKEERFGILKHSSDSRAALRNQLNWKYSEVALKFKMSKDFQCGDASESLCLGPALDKFCLKFADKNNLSWQHCASAVVWIIGGSH